MLLLLVLSLLLLLLLWFLLPPPMLLLRRPSPGLVFLSAQCGRNRPWTNGGNRAPFDRMIDGVIAGAALMRGYACGG